MMLLALITAQDTRHAKLAARFPGYAKTSSVIRRIERFFQQHPLCPLDVARVVLWSLRDGKRTFILDRTNWKLGQHDVNIVVLAARLRGVAVPLLWELLDHGGGSSHTARAELLSHAVELLKPHQIRLLIAERREHKIRRVRRANWAEWRVGEHQLAKLPPLRVWTREGESLAHCRASCGPSPRSRRSERRACP